MAAEIKPYGRFWGRGSSESSSDASSESSSGEEVTDDDKDDSSNSGSSIDSGDDARPDDRYVTGFSYSGGSSGEDEVRVAKPEKVRRMEELRTACDELWKKMKIKDWNAIQTAFTKLNQQMERTVKAIGDGTIPKRYVRMLVRLEDFCLEVWSDVEGRKKMSPSSLKALTVLKHKLMKHNKNYIKEMAEVRAHPLPSEEGSNLSESTESELGDVAPPDAAELEGKKQDSFRTMDPADITYAMVSEKLHEIMQTRGKRGTDKNERLEMLQYLVSVARGSSQTVTVLSHVISSLFDLNPNMTTHMRISQWKYCVHCCFQILDILKEHPSIKLVVEMDQLEERKEAPDEENEVAMAWCPLVSFVERLDDEFFKSLQFIDPHTHLYLQRLKDEVFFLALGRKVLTFVQEHEGMKGRSMLALRLMEHYYYKAETVYAALRNLAIQKQCETEVVEDQTSAITCVRTNGSFGFDVTGADGDLTGDEEEDKAGDDFDYEQMVLKIPQDFQMEESPYVAMEVLGQIVFVHGDEREKARATLMSIYHKCIHDDFYTARDRLLMSHLQDNAGMMDILTQVLHNRTAAQMGLAAFRAGLITDAQSCLSELYAGGRIKELLAQGVAMNRYQEKTPEQEKRERQRQMPFHMHINLELLECVHLISAMLLEVPSLAASALSSTSHRVISKPFTWLLDNYTGHTFSGPPENVKDHVVAATKAMMRGDWKSAYDFVTALSCWNLMQNKDSVLEMLKVKMKEEALRTFLFSYSEQYISLSRSQLCDMFELPAEKVQPHLPMASV